MIETPELISECFRKARKPHTCDYCGELINPGETYHHSVCKYDDIYTWNSHGCCDYIASALWDWLDPNDWGLDSDSFKEGCEDFCQRYVCKQCQLYDPMEMECSQNKCYCLNKIEETLHNFSLHIVKDDKGWLQWKLIPKIKEEI